MRKLRIGKLSQAAIVFIALIAGCGREQSPVLIPAVISTLPANGAVGVAVAQVITATFNEPMNGATITASTFKVAGPGGVAVAGTVASSGNTATFTPTALLVINVLYTATITTGATDNAGIALAANSVWSFTTGTGPKVVSTTPASGAVGVSVAQIVTATFSKVMNAATITASTFTLTGPGVTPVAGVVTYAGTTATLAPSAALAASTLYTATISTGAKDTTGNSLASNFVWTFTTGAIPAVTSTIPANAAIAVPVAQVITATFNQPMNAATINGVSFTVTGPGATPVVGVVSYSGSTATFTPAASLVASTLYTATITTAAKNPAGDALPNNFVWSFTTGTIPTVTATNPANGAIGVPVAQAISATFSEAMNAATITASTFTLTGPGATSVAGVVTFAGTTATFTPNAALAGSTLYTATITTGAKDTTGNSLASNFVWTFTTGTIPTVILTNPLNGAINAPTNQKLTATFSQAMNAATITAPGTFTLAVAGGGAAVPGTVTFVGTLPTATFAPTANLLPSTQYTATISTAAQSASGNALASNFVWSFTTGAAPDLTKPAVILTVPASAAVGVATNQAVTATFNEVMDPATITAAGTFTLATTVGSVAVPATVSYAGSIATLTPTSALAANTQFTATITVAAKDLAGNALIAGAVPNPWSFTTGAAPDTTPPTITLTSPANADISVPLSATVSATFSEAMDPLTIVAPGTFKLAVAGIGGAAVSGNVTYDSVTNIATFTPSAGLAPTTQYTATVTNAAKDLAGNALAAGVAANPWSFTTGAAAGPSGANLGTSAVFGSFGGNAGITNQGINTVINGNIGTTGASTIVTGFHDAGPGCTYTETGSNVGLVNGNIDTAAPPPTVGCPSEGTAATAAIATQAGLDALAAYNSLTPASRPGGTDPGAGQLGGLVLAPGTYKAALGSFLITGTDLTLDAQGNANAVWVFQMASSLTVGAPGAPRSIILVNGAQAKNVYWQVGSSATINPAGGGTMVGTIISSAGISFSTAGNAAITTLNGRAFSLTASVTMVNTVINVPAP